MDIPGQDPWMRIKSNLAKLVKTGLVLACLSACAALSADDAQPELQQPRRNPFFGTPIEISKPLSVTPHTITQSLPPIQARKFNVRVVQLSHSENLYVLEDDAPERPLIGHIILLKSGQDPVMAFRVLRTYPGKRQFIGRKVRRYGDHLRLDLDSQFEALEKIGELAPPPPAPPTTVQEDQEIQDLENDQGLLPGPESIPAPSPSPSPSLEASEPEPELAPTPEPTETAVPQQQSAPAPSDSELESLERSLDQAGADPAPQPTEAPSPDPTPPSDTAEAAPAPPAETTDEEEEADSDRTLALAIQEVEPMDRAHNGVTLEFGSFRNFSAGGSSYGYFGGGGFRYALTPFHMIFASSRSVQDSLSFEGGMFFYKALNYGTTHAAVTVMPLIGTVRYNLLFSSNLGLFFYGGGMRNQVIGSSQATQAAIARLSSILPAFGGGMIFRIGPGWEFRFDTGTDMIGAGLVLRF
jgi:hypothetical protein